MSTTIILSKDFLDGYNQSVETAIQNLASMILVEMKKLSPYARPSQYPGGYRGRPGTLMRSLVKKGAGRQPYIGSSVGYAIRRNYENNLNPQTKHYVERSIKNVLRGKQSQWWIAE